MATYIFETCGSILKFRLPQLQSTNNVSPDTSSVSFSDDIELSVQFDVPVASVAVPGETDDFVLSAEFKVPVASVAVPDEVDDDSSVLIDDPRVLHVIECVLSAEFKVLVASLAVLDEIGDDSSVLPDELEVSRVSLVNDFVSSNDSVELKIFSVTVSRVFVITVRKLAVGLSDSKISAVVIFGEFLVSTSVNSFLIFVVQF
ncbi:unnamed protein product [Enterobius vermicularis]|uniref:Secreted protein n=1 Tax=Enterobius vermicularis TaxID=51028 RepID=A0A0N4VQ99_ENTVE|nr:unnamed protein product [Enterobius vermicularis]